MTTGKNHQMAIRLRKDWWNLLQAQAEREIKPQRRTGPTGRTAALVRKMIAEGLKTRGLDLEVNEYEPN